MRLKSPRSEINYQMILNIVLVLVGIVFLLFPAKGLAFITWILGIALCLGGVVCAVIFVLNRRDPNIPLIIVAGAAVIIGILIMVFRMWIATVALPVIIGLWVIASAVLCIMSAMGYKKMDAQLWWFPLIAALIALIIAVLIFANLSGTARLLGYAIGIYFVVYSSLRIGENFALRKYL